MFTELMPILKSRPVTITITAVDKTKIRVNVIPKAVDSDSQLTREVSYQGGFVNLATGQMAPIPVTQCERKRKHTARDSVSPARPGGRGRFPQVRSGERFA